MRSILAPRGTAPESGETTRRRRAIPPATWVIVAFVGLVFALSFGFNYGTSNQNTYLLGALRQVHPELLSQDWFATQTTEYHNFFSYLVSPLMRLDSSGWLVAMANTLSILVVAVIIFLIARHATSRARHIPVFVLVMAIGLATATFSAGYTYLSSTILQPSTIGVAGLLLACYLFLKKRYILSGLALAVGGLFHVNYLLLGLLVFFVAHLLLGRQGLASRMVRQFAAPLLALIPFMPVLVETVSTPGSNDAYFVYTHIRSPHHYVPREFWHQFLPLAGWLLLWVVSVPKKDFLNRRLSPATALILALSFLVFVGTLLTTFVYVFSVAKIFVWRLCPILVLLAQVYVARAMFRALDSEEYDGIVRSFPQRVLWVVVSICLIVVGYVYLGPSPPIVILVRVLLIAVALAWITRVCAWSWPLRAARLSMAVALVAFLALGTHALTQLQERSSLLRSPDPAEESLSAWAQGTDVDAVFLVPPNMKGFRFEAQRAIVVDWKSVPARPAEIDDWYSRITAVSGGTPPRSPTEALYGYRALTENQYQALADRFGVSYVVIEISKDTDPPQSWPTVFSNERYGVLRVPSD